MFIILPGTSSAVPLILNDHQAALSLNKSGVALFLPVFPSLKLFSNFFAKE